MIKIYRLHAMILGNFVDFILVVESIISVIFSVIESLQIKELIMEKARYSQDKSVREQALLALQKLMIQNWQNIWSSILNTKVILFYCTSIYYLEIIIFINKYLIDLISSHINTKLIISMVGFGLKDYVMNFSPAK
mgnify:CR=1 FL=1